jgi:hypothetical protein
MNRFVDRPFRAYDDDVAVGEYVILAVSDDGSGISPDDLERIFEPFYTKKVMGSRNPLLSSGFNTIWRREDVLLYFKCLADAVPCEGLQILGYQTRLRPSCKR